MAKQGKSGYDKLGFIQPDAKQPSIEEKTVIIQPPDSPAPADGKHDAAGQAELAARVAAEKQKYDEMERMKEENLARLTTGFAGTMLRGREVPPLVVREGTPPIIGDLHMLLVELQVGGAIQPHNVLMGQKVNQMILRIADGYGVTGG